MALTLAPTATVPDHLIRAATAAIARQMKTLRKSERKPVKPDRTSNRTTPTIIFVPRPVDRT